MSAQQTGGQAYTCPMHKDVRQAGPRFGMVRHMLSSPMHIGVMALVMVALMAAAMMMLR
jgi:hypothetical protein